MHPWILKINGPTKYMPAKKNIFKKGYRAVKKLFKKLSPFALLQLKSKSRAKKVYSHGYKAIARMQLSRDPNAPAPIHLNHIKRYRKLGHKNMQSDVHPPDVSTYTYGTCCAHAGPITSYYAFECGSVYDISDIIGKMTAVDGSVAGFSGKLDLQDSQLNLRMTNAAQSTTSLVVYEYLARRDVPDSIGSIASIVNNGFSAQTVAQITNESLGGSLFQNPLFCSMYQITNVQKRELHPGATLELSTNGGPKMINPIVWNSSTGQAVGLYTRGFVVQMTGMACNGTGETNNTVEIAGVKIDVVATLKYHFRSVFDAVGRNYYTNGITANTVKNYVNPVSGDIQNDNTA